MKKIDDITRIRHMLESANEARQFLGELPFEEFRQNRQLAHAIMRTLEIVGEAASQITQEYCNKHPEIEWRTIIGMRNRLVHAYFDINYRVVWETVIEKNQRFLIEDLTKGHNQNGFRLS